MSTKYQKKQPEFEASVKRATRLTGEWLIFIGALVCYFSWRALSYDRKSAYTPQYSWRIKSIDILNKDGRPGIYALQHSPLILLVAGGLFIAFGLWFIATANIRSKNQEPYDKHATFSRSTYYTQEAIVRMIILCIFLLSFIDFLLYNYYSTPDLPGEQSIPLLLIISLNAILLYYGISPKNVLPSSLVYTGEIQ